MSMILLWLVLFFMPKELLGREKERVALHAANAYIGFYE